MNIQRSKSPFSVVIPKEPLAGADNLLETTRAAREFRYLDLICERHRQYGNTFVTRRILYETVNTRDPENLKQSESVYAARHFQSRSIDEDQSRP